MVNYCPRCGWHVMMEPKEINALSRFRDEYVCSDCGVDEAIRQYMGIDDIKWAIDEEGA